MLTIRKARRSDLDALVSLWKELSEHHVSFGRRDRNLTPHLRQRPDAARVFAAWARKHVGSRKGVVYLAEVDGKPAGYTLVFIKRNPFHSKVREIGFIDQLLVKGKFRGRKISSALFREAMVWFRRKRIRHLSLFVMERNRIPQSIYRKWGFFPFVVEMRKNL